MTDDPEPRATALVGLDWGTTRLRAYRIAAGGRILDRRSRDAGILKVEGGDFAGALTATAGDWLEQAPEAPVLAAGMIGSRQGWREVPYVPCPAGLAELVAGLVAVELGDGRALWLVPGMARSGDAVSAPDVMRGEETQVMGLLATAGPEPRCVVLPGTHSKWVWTEGGRILRFATWMTGEVFDVLSRHSILGRLMTGTSVEPAAFDRGLARSAASARASPGRLLHDLFSARSLVLFGELPGAAAAGYLSGLLIGAEVAAGMAEHATEQVTILGGGELASLYARALARAGVAAEIGDPDVAVPGLLAMAKAAGLMGDTLHV